MTGPFRRLCPPLALGLFLALAAGGHAASLPSEPVVFPLAEVVPGLEGWGETVLEGTERVRFQMKVLGVLRGQAPGRDAILVRLSGAGLERSRIIAGMSGSPVYVNDRLLGAVAFTWAFAKDAVGGVTPIEAMLDEARRPEPPSAKRSHGLLPPAAEKAGAEGLRRSLTPLVFSGFHPRVLADLDAEFRGRGFLPLAGAGGGAAAGERLGRPLVGGDAMGVRLVRGDWNVTAVGTVTAVAGDRVLGFGHPFMGGGWWSAPLCAARVHTVLASEQLSFKIASPLEDVGRLVLDRPSGIVGVLDEEAPMCPVRLELVQLETDRRRTVSVEVVDHPQLTPRFLLAVLGNALAEAQSAVGPLTVDMDMRLRLRGEDPLHLREAWVSEGDGPAAPPLVAGLMTLLQNPFRPVRVASLDLSLRSRPGREAALLEAVWAGRDEARAGEELALRLRLRHGDGRREIRPLRFRLPATLEDGPLRIRVGGPEALPRGSAPPRELADVMAELAARRPPRSLICRVPLPTRGLVRPGRRLPRLEGTRARILAAAGETRPSEDFVDTVHSMPCIVTGLCELVLHVKKRRKP